MPRRTSSASPLPSGPPLVTAFCEEDTPPTVPAADPLDSYDPGGVNFVWRTDVHLSDEPPSARLDDWMGALFSKLHWVGELAGRVGATAVLDGGDLFHIKTPSRNSHSLVRRLIEEVHSKYPCPVYGNVGNHDVRLGNVAYLHESPLSVLFASRSMLPLWGPHEAYFPGPPSVRVVGIEYHGPKYDLGRLESVRKGGEDFLMVICHLLSSPTDTSMFGSEDIITYKYLDSLPPGCADVFAFGHWHKDQGVTTLPGGRIVFNVGSLSRGSLSEDDMGRTPKVAVVSFKQGLPPSVVPVAVPVRPASEVFRVRESEGKVLRVDAIDAIAASFVRQASATSSRSALELIRSRSMGVDPAVVEKAIHFVENVS